MNQVIDAILGEELSPDEQNALRRLLAKDPGLAEAFATWRRVQGHLGQSLNQQVSDRRLLVYYALEAAGQSTSLAEGERHALQAAKPALEKAMALHPGLEDVVRRIRTDAELFDQVWGEHVEGVRQVPSAAPVVTRRDRRPVPTRSAAYPPGTRRWAWRIGSVLALVAFGLIALLIIRRDEDLVAVYAAEGEVRIVELADGSVVRLLGGSSLSFVPADEAAAFRRYARLNGRAFFDIAPNEQTFTIETPTAAATVLGTSFGIEASEDLTEVVLATGRLAVAPVTAPSEMVVLNEGEMVRVGRNARPSTPVPVEVAQRLEWTGLFIFRTTPVQDIADQLSRHFGVDIRVDPDLEQEPVSGTFEQEQGAAEILDAVAATLGASVQVEDGRYVLH